MNDDPARRVNLEDKFFFNVVGYSDIKKLLLKSVISKELVNILLSGRPSSSKTVFLLEILEGLDDTYFLDGAGASAAGITDYLFNSNTKYLLIDEIDKMKKMTKRPSSILWKLEFFVKLNWEAILDRKR